MAWQAPLFGPQVVTSPPPVNEVRRTRPPRAVRLAGDTSDPQQSLFVVHTEPPSRTLKTSVDSSLYCDATVASPLHRALAAGLDVAMTLIGACIILAIFLLGGGEIVLNKQTWPVYAAIPAGVNILYRLLWCIGNGDTPGMRWTRLKLLNFDGEPPIRRERLSRFLAACLSFSAAGLGVLWALTDEEKLTWHDHISKTFPTPV